MEYVYAALGITVFLLFYFLPTIIGFHKRSGFAIFFLNLAFGWTIIGYVAAFIWACVSRSKEVI